MNIILTGASRGAGKYLYEKLTYNGHKVMGMGLGGPDITADFRIGMSPEWVRDIIDRFFGRNHVDCLVNNAGMAHCDWIEDYPQDKFQDILQVNLYAPFVLTQQTILHNDWVELATQFEQPCRVINVSSMGAHIGLRGSPAYCASKAGLEALTKVLAKEHAGRKPYYYYALALGGVDDTAMQKQVEDDLVRMRGMSPEEASAYNRQSPMGRNMSIAEVVDLMDWCIHRAPEYLSGTTIQCSGGMGI